MSKPKIAVLSFPGNNCEVESLRAIERNGMDAVFFRWNDLKEKLTDVDGYFLPGGFSYEDRGRAGMVAARDPLLEFIGKEAQEGKVVIGNCNGAQILVESGLIPLGKNLSMSLAQNVSEGSARGFLNEWIWITPACKSNRCATSNWNGVMHIPLAHGEGRFTTKDSDLLGELSKNDQIAFSYCDEQGKVTEAIEVNPNGSALGIAGICNPQGNVVALMPHPERTGVGDPYFQSLKQWIENSSSYNEAKQFVSSWSTDMQEREPREVEIFIETIIVNNEERTVEQTLKRILPDVSLKQYRYIACAKSPKEILSDLSLFNPNKESAFIRRGGKLFVWDADSKKEIDHHDIFDNAVALLRRDDPDTGAATLGQGGESGICYVMTGEAVQTICSREVLEILGNPHASTIELLR